jgi:hypothetical protein
MNFFSISVISGSFACRPTSRFREPIVFLKFEVSRVFADSPIARDLGPNEMRELSGADRKSIDRGASEGLQTHGVTRFDTSLAITSIPRCLATPIYKCNRSLVHEAPILH